MAWDDAPPENKSWDDKPPTKQEMGKLSMMERLGFGQDPKEKQAMLTQAMNEQVGSPEQRRAESSATIQKGLNLLPPAGGVLGGMGGAAAGTMVAPGPGTIAGEYTGAGLGSATGEGLKYAGEKYLLGKDMSQQDLGSRLATAGAAGVIGQGFGNMMNAAGKSFAQSGIQDVSQTLAKPGADQIRAAAGRLAVEPTQGMLTDDYTVRNLENSLSQSPSLPGSAIRSEQKPVREAISGAVKGATDDASHLTDYEQGKSLKQGVGKYFEDRYQPIKDSYGEIEGHTKNIELDGKGLKRIAKNIRGLDEARFSGSEGNTIANQFAGWLEDAKDVNDIKLLKTKAGHILRDPNASFEAKSVASSITQKLEQAQTNSITRQAVQIAREAPVDKTAAGKFLNKAQKGVADEEATAEGQDLGRRLIGDIKSTNKQYRGLLEDAKTFGSGSGLTKANKGMSATLSDIESASPEEMSKALFDQNNVDYMKFVQDKMPKQFEQARQQKIAEIIHKTGGDTNKIIKLTEKMGPEARTMLFGEKNVANLSDASTLLKSIPEKVGASDTPRGFQFHEMMNPMNNLRDVGRYGLLKGKKNLPKAGLLMQKASPYGQGLMNKGLLDERQD